MGAMFRSEEMTLCQLFLQSDSAYSCISELGENSLVQFKDLNPEVNAFQRKFVNEIMRCEEMERKLRYIEKELKKDELGIPDSDSNPKAPAPKEMVDLEATFEKIETELREVNTNAEVLKRNFLELTELKEVLRTTQVFFREQGHHSIVDDAQSALVHDDRGGAIQLGFIAGVIPREKVPAFERMLWFACRGNVFLRYEDMNMPLKDPHTGDEIHKGVFIIFFQGEQLKSRTRKICEGFKATLYPCPETAQERQEMLNGVSTRLDDLNIVLKQTMDHRHRVLLNSQKEIHNWIIKVKKIKAIYNTLNMCNFDFSRNNLIAECWAPVEMLDEVNAALRHGTPQMVPLKMQDKVKIALAHGQETSGSSVPNILHRMTTKETPPTCFRTNKFTKVFQGIVNSYGVATYREVNPAPYTIISFPFLFAVMFGDTGHGFIMFLFGFWMVLSEKKLTSQKSDNEIWKNMLSGRYIIMLMGLFSLYTGLIYNDTFSKSINLFGSSWQPNYTHEALDGPKSLQLKPEDFFYDGNSTMGPYPFGLDPIWQASTNKITFTNSFKMKLSVILGVSQMLLGVILSVINHIHFGHYLFVLVQFVPEVLFLLSIFGYLITLVFYKWVSYNAWCTGCSPALLIHFINMFLVKYTPVDDKIYSKYNGTAEDSYHCKKFDYMVASEMGCGPQTIFYQNQQLIQTALILVALCCIPVLLLVKPFYLRAQYKNRMKRKHGLSARSHEQLVRHEFAPGQEPEPKGDKSQSGIEMAGVSSSDVSVSINGGNSDPVITIDMDEDEDEKFDFSDIFVGQAIHTIEYCLGCVSHTASYLRLWALSLAHAQLSEVLWSMLFRVVLSLDIPYGGSVIVFFGFGAFAVLTVAVLLVMEGLSAFLHTLRLHWVEFQSKFYHGDGYLFAPFNFKDEMDATLDDKR